MCKCRFILFRQVCVNLVALFKLPGTACPCGIYSRSIYVALENDLTGERDANLE